MGSNYPPIEPPWRNSAARNQLWSELLQGVHDGKAWTEVYESKVIYTGTNKTLFKSRLSSLRKQVDDYKQTNDLARWDDKNKTRMMLIKDVASGYCNDKTWMEVYESRDEYKKTSKAKFEKRLNDIKSRFKAKVKAIEFDKAAVEHDTPLLPSRKANGKAFWHHSDAERFLKLDVKDGKHLTTSTAELYESRDAYRVFPQIVFRQHVTQEKRNLKPFKKAKAKK